MSTFDDECRSVGLLPAALPDAQRRYAERVAGGGDPDVRGFLDTLNRDAGYLFKPSKGGGAGSSAGSLPAPVEAAPAVGGPLEMAKAILHPATGTATLRAIASGALRADGSERSPDVDLGAPPGWWAEREARRAARDAAALPRSQRRTFSGSVSSKRSSRTRRRPLRRSCASSAFDEPRGSAL